MAVAAARTCVQASRRSRRVSALDFGSVCTALSVTLLPQSGEAMAGGSVTPAQSVEHPATGRELACLGIGSVKQVGERDAESPADVRELRRVELARARLQRRHTRLGRPQPLREFGLRQAGPSALRPQCAREHEGKGVGGHSESIGCRQVALHCYRFPYPPRGSIYPDSGRGGLDLAGGGEGATWQGSRTATCRPRNKRQDTPSSGCGGRCSSTRGSRGSTCGGCSSTVATTTPPTRSTPCASCSPASPTSGP